MPKDRKLPKGLQTSSASKQQQQQQQQQQEQQQQEQKSTRTSSIKKSPTTKSDQKAQASASSSSASTASSSVAAATAGVAAVDLNSPSVPTTVSPVMSQQDIVSAKQTLEVMKAQREQVRIYIKDASKDGRKDDIVSLKLSEKDLELEIYRLETLIRKKR